MATVDTEQRLNIGTSQHWNIQPSAGHIMERQVDTVSCGLYCMMIPDCLTHGIDIRLLTPTSVIKCRRRIAQALLEKVLPDIRTTLTAQECAGNRPVVDCRSG